MNTSQTILFSLLTLMGYAALHSTDMDSWADEYVTRSGKSLHIAESHPQGQSLSDIHFNSSGFEHDLSETVEESDPIKDVYVADLDGNGFDEFYIVTISSGSGSYGNIIAFGSNRDKSLSRIYFPEFQEGDERFAGYMGHDEFRISENKLIRSFPIYLLSDKNAKPSGGTRQLTYGLYPGETSYQLKIVEVTAIH